MGNVVTQKFYSSSSWTAPAGVTSVKVYGVYQPSAALNSGGQCSMLLDSAGNLWAWGNNAHGQLGTNSVNSLSSPTLVVGGLTFVQASFERYGCTDSMGLTNTGKLYGWGYNAGGQAGVGNTNGISSPTLVLGGLNFAQFAQSNGCTCAITQSGQAWGWGNLGGNGTNTPVSSPVAVSGGLTFGRVFSNGDDEGATLLTPQGTLYYYGNQNFGEAGDNTAGGVTTYSSPNLVVGGLTWATVASMAQGCRIALTTGGQCYAWGYNANGQLGVGNTVNRSSPTLVLGSHTFTQIFSGNTGNGSTCMGIDTAGQLWAWGNNANGQCGQNSLTHGSYSSPTLVVGGLTWAKAWISPFNNAGQCFGLTTNGQLYAWGSNSNGALGINSNTNTSYSSPTLVVGGLTFTDLILNNDAQGIDARVLAMTNSGQLYAWGANANGQLGNGSVTVESSPVLVVGSAASNVTPTTATVVVPVIPGTSYPISMSQYTMFFGNTAVGQGPIVNVQGQTMSITLEYEQ